MRKLYEKKQVLFAVLWIVAYCLVMAPIKGAYGFGGIWTLLALACFAAAITGFVRANHLEQTYGLDAWAQNAKGCLYFIPMWILAVGNAWDGFSLSYHGTALACAVVSMLLVGYVEEMIFRGFLFKAMLADNKTIVAIIVSSLTFGMGHIINLLTGQAGFDTVCQMLFAVSWGFILTMAYYKGGSLWPCIIAHGMVDACSLFGADTVVGDWAYIIATIVIGAVYCLYLTKQETPEQAS